MGSVAEMSENPQRDDVKPVLFTSHKHSDARIAELVAKFVRRITGVQIEVFLSSHPSFVGPRAGKELGGELKGALGRAEVVVLVYTTTDNDWSWCIWECGLAEDPREPSTTIVLFQCLKDSPDVFDGGVKINAWNSDSLNRFAKRFRGPELFPHFGRPATGLSAE